MTSGAAAAGAAVCACSGDNTEARPSTVGNTRRKGNEHREKRRLAKWNWDIKTDLPQGDGGSANNKQRKWGNWARVLVATIVKRRSLTGRDRRHKNLY